MKRLPLYVEAGILLLSACHDLNLNPLSSGSIESWYSTEAEVQMAVGELYRYDFWPEDEQQQTDWSDDYTSRDLLTSFGDETLNGQNAWVASLWGSQCRAISHTDAVIEKSHHAIENGASAITTNRLIAETKFHGTVAYARLIVRFDDLPLILANVGTEEGLITGRTGGSIILAQIHKDFDGTINVLPTSYADQQRATQGAVLASKARVALIMEGWETATDATKAVMDSDIHELHPDFDSLLLSTTKNSNEFIFRIPRDATYDIYLGTENGGVNQVYNDLPRNVEGWTQTCPSWELPATFTCIDGLLINESPLFDPHEPFINRDPRLAETIIPFSSNHLGYEYDPHPEALTCMNYNIGEIVTNYNTCVNAQYASFDGLMWKKGIDGTWLQNDFKVDQDVIYCHCAEILSIYAEAKIELDEVSNSVLDALNEVRTHTYGVDRSGKTDYLVFTSNDQSTLRHQLRVEHRMGMAKEHMRHTDIIRWKLTGRVMNHRTYGILYPASLCIERVTSQGDWFWTFTPEMDEDGCVDFSKLEEAGKCQALTVRSWNGCQYLWPVPITGLQTNESLEQNPGYQMQESCW